jgi:hypothetical protein
MSVADKICKIMQAVGYMKKDKQLQGGGSYSYLSAEKITSELHAAFADAGLIVFPLAMEMLRETRTDTTKAGSQLFNERILATYRFMDTEDGSTIDAQAIGEGSDQGDKVMNKCMTAAYKYCLRQTFMISTGADPDATPSEETASSNYQGQRQQPQAPQPQRQQAAAPPQQARSASQPAQTQQSATAQLTALKKQYVTEVKAAEIPRAAWNEKAAAAGISDFGTWTVEQARQALNLVAAYRDGLPPWSAAEPPSEDIQDVFANQ